MPLVENTIQASVNAQIDAKLSTVWEASMDRIETAQREMQAGQIPKGGEPCKQYVRSIRKDILTRCREVKAWLDTGILSMITQSVSVDPLLTLQEKEKQASSIDADKKKTEDKKDRICQDKKSLRNYEKFLLYGGHVQRGKQQEPNERALGSYGLAIERAAAQTYRQYTVKRLFRIFLGVIVTILCAAADYSIIFSVFQASNMSIRLSVLTALITATALDMPPYILGFLRSKRDDTIRLWKYRDEPEDPGAVNELKSYKRAMTLLMIAIVLLFSAYIILRILLFLGGGEFDEVLHAILKRDYSFATFTFNSADLLSTFVPFGTSAVAFAVGLMLSASNTDYVKTTVLVIDREMEDCIGKCQRAVIEYTKQLDDLKRETAELMQTIWTTYMGWNAKTMPNDYSEFIAQITDVYRGLNFPQYGQAYATGAERIRVRAERMLEQASQEMMPYVSIPKEIIDMPVSEEEQVILNEIWVTGHGADQMPGTKEMLHKIDEHIKQFQRQLEEHKAS